MGTKIATCCYCGARAALTLRGKVQHELSCSNCGAPLHEMKNLPVDARGERELVKKSPIRNPNWKMKGHRAPKKNYKKKKKKGFWAELVEEAVDEVFDIFD